MKTFLPLSWVALYLVAFWPELNSFAGDTPVSVPTVIPLDGPTEEPASKGTSAGTESVVDLGEAPAPEGPSQAEPNAIPPPLPVKAKKVVAAPSPSPEKSSEAVSQAPEPTPVPEPAPAPPAEIQTQKVSTRIPKFHRAKPSWAFGLHLSNNALGTPPLIPQIGTDQSGKNVSTYAVGMLLEYQPRFLQSVGVIGLGPSATVYPIWGSSAVSTPFSVFSVGGQIRYQARFFRQQILVPNVGYAAEYMHYFFNGITGPGTSGAVLARGPIYGLWLLLNFFGTFGGGGALRG